MTLLGSLCSTKGSSVSNAFQDWKLKALKGSLLGAPLTGLPLSHDASYRRPGRAVIAVSYSHKLTAQTASQPAQSCLGLRTCGKQRLMNRSHRPPRYPVGRPQGDVHTTSPGFGGPTAGPLSQEGEVMLGGAEGGALADGSYASLLAELSQQQFRHIFSRHLLVCHLQDQGDKRHIMHMPIQLLPPKLATCQSAHNTGAASSSLGYMSKLNCAAVASLW